MENKLNLVTSCS